MNISEPFIRRPVATTLLTVAIALAGAVAFRLLPVSPLPQVDFPTISVQAGLPGDELLQPTPPPYSHPASNVKVNAPLEMNRLGLSRYLTWMLSSV